MARQVFQLFSNVGERLMHAWPVVHISMYAWHICFYPSIIASAVSADVNYSKGHRNNVHGREGKSNTIENKKSITNWGTFAFLCLPVIDQLFP